MARWARERGRSSSASSSTWTSGHTNGWRLDDVVPAEEIVARIDAEMPLEPLPAQYRGEVAGRWRYRDGDGRAGRHRLGQPAVLRRLHAGAAVGRGQALHVPVRVAGATTSGRPCERRHRRRAARTDRSRLARPDRPLLGAADARPRPTCPGRDVRTSAADPDFAGIAVPAAARPLCCAGTLAHERVPRAGGWAGRGAPLGAEVERESMTQSGPPGAPPPPPALRRPRRPRDRARCSGGSSAVRSAAAGHHRPRRDGCCARAGPPDRDVPAGPADRRSRPAPTACRVSRPPPTVDRLADGGSPADRR